MDTSWRDDAACKGLDANEWVKPVAREAGADSRIEIYAGCPVAAGRLDMALSKPEWSLGVWGGTIVPGRAAIAREMRKVIEDGSDLRTAAFWSRFCGDAAIRRDVTVAVEAPDHLAAMLAARAGLSVVAATALLARHAEAIAETIASRADLPKWLSDIAARIAGSTHRDARRVANTERMRRVRARRSNVAA